MYGKVLIDHLDHPRNFGELKQPDGLGIVESPLCGDLIRMFIKVASDRISDIRFKSEGCGAAIASSSLATEMMKGKRLDDALAITSKQIATRLGGLPENKIHCAVLAQDALKIAVQDYRAKRGEI
jgi:nitrogen fixation NifU-like protein